jgi:hypothetical protein
MQLGFKFYRIVSCLHVIMKLKIFKGNVHVKL